MAMEDFRVDVIVGKGPGATAIPLELPPVHPGRRHHPGRDCCRPRCATASASPRHMEFYDPAELERVIHRSAGLLDVEIDAGGRRRDRRPLPRHAPYRQPAAAPRPGLRAGQGGRRDHPGDRRRGPGGLRGGRPGPGPAGPRRCSSALLKLFGGGPVGLSTLAVAVGEERETVEEVAEPFLVREGLLARTPRGRVATPAAWAHLGLTPPAPAAAGGNGQQGLFGA